MQGPITVFDGTTYAGDARILDLQPKEERLITYAIDLGTEVEPVVRRAARTTSSQIKIDRGIVETTHKVASSQDLQRSRTAPSRTASLL